MCRVRRDKKRKRHDLPTPITVSMPKCEPHFDLIKILDARHLSHRLREASGEVGRWIMISVLDQIEPR